jgi:hypothetical protein
LGTHAVKTEAATATTSAYRVHLHMMAMFRPRI